mgnify:CR=1 FL=1
MCLSSSPFVAPPSVAAAGRPDSMAKSLLALALLAPLAALALMLTAGKKPVDAALARTLAELEKHGELDGLEELRRGKE